VPTSRKDGKKGLPGLPRVRGGTSSPPSARLVEGERARVRSAVKTFEARVPQVSGPEIKVDYTAAGRDTLAAIAEELASGDTSSPHSAAPETLESHEALPSAGPRARMSTFGYGDRLSNAPGAIAPPPRPRGARHEVAVPDPDVSISESDDEETAVIEIDMNEPATRVRTRQRTHDFKDRPRSRDTSPEVITIEERPAGRETLAAIAEELARENRSALQSDPDEAPEPPRPRSVPPLPRRSQPPPRPAEGEADIMEMVTFVVRGRELTRLSSESARREFVAERLMHRLPVDSLDDVDRIDVTPWTVQGTVILRVWCRVADP
jgi:hypothetical protein